LLNPPKRGSTIAIMACIVMRRAIGHAQLIVPSDEKDLGNGLGKSPGKSSPAAFGTAHKPKRLAAVWAGGRQRGAAGR
jgi:hypothetical protein